jgi:hypothetical protein
MDRVELSMLVPIIGLGDSAFGVKYRFTEPDATHAFAGSARWNGPPAAGPGSWDLA